MATPGCALCGSTDDLEAGRIIARERLVCATCKGALYSILDSRDGGDPEIPQAAETERIQAASMPALWLAFREIQGGIDAAKQKHRDDEEAARQEQLRLAREEEERVRVEAEEKAKAEVEAALAEREKAERELAETAAAAKKAIEDREAARDQQLAELHEKVDRLTGMLLERK